MKAIAIIFGLISLVACGSAAAQPARCTQGYSDASCAGVLMNAPQAAPTCSSGAGWKTTAPAVWAGSKYTAPQCNYTAAPECPSGYTQTQAPTWDGANWNGLQCTPIQTPPAPPPANSCSIPTNVDIYFVLYIADYDGEGNPVYGAKWYGVVDGQQFQFANFTEGPAYRWEPAPYLRRNGFDLDTMTYFTSVTPWTNSGIRDGGIGFRDTDYGHHAAPPQILGYDWDTAVDDNVNWPRITCSNGVYSGLIGFHAYDNTGG